MTAKEVPAPLPCPFCGGVGEMFDSDDPAIQCVKCGAFGPVGEGKTRVEARELWNRRVSPSVAPPALSDAMIDKALAAESEAFSQARIGGRILDNDDRIRAIAAALACSAPSGDRSAVIEECAKVADDYERRARTSQGHNAAHVIAGNIRALPSRLSEEVQKERT